MILAYWLGITISILHTHWGIMRVRIDPHECAGMQLTIPDADIVIEADVTSDGRIYGLKKYAGRTVKIVVLEEKRKK